MFLKRKIIIYSIVFGIIAIGLVVFAIFPFLNGVRENSEKLVAIRRDLISTENKSANFEKIKKNYEDCRISLEKMEMIFIDAEMPIDLIKSWEKSALNSGVLINISSIPTKDAKDALWNSIAFQVVVKGSFPDFLKFLEKIETSSYLVKIKNLTIKKLSETELKSIRYEYLSAGDINATLTIKIYTKSANSVLLNKNEN